MKYACKYITTLQYIYTYFDITSCEKKYNEQVVVSTKYHHQTISFFFFLKKSTVSNNQILLHRIKHDRLSILGAWVATHTIIYVVGKSHKVSIGCAHLLGIGTALLWFQISGTPIKIRAPQNGRKFMCEKYSLRQQIWDTFQLILMRRKKNSITKQCLAILCHTKVSPEKNYIRIIEQACLVLQLISLMSICLILALL